jgi:hypothetical protein
MIDILDEYFPLEITDLIYKEFHRDCLREISIILSHKIVFVLVGERISFLICEGQSFENYFCPLLNQIEL